MEKPTLEEIKERYKYAKSVRCLDDGKIHQYKEKIRISMSPYGEFFWLENGLSINLLYNPNKGKYAEIVEYKTEEIPVKHEDVKIEGLNEKELFFENIVNETIDKIKKTLIIKAKEYRRNNNPFHNFEEGSKITGLTREKVLDGMLLKHEISIKDITNDLDYGILPSESVVDEKFTDNIIYLIIKKASILDKINNNKLNSK